MEVLIFIAMKININCGFATILTLLFVTLKLTDVIDWSWWWVLSPLWITAILILVTIVGLFFYYIRKR